MYDVRFSMYDLAKPGTQLGMIREPFELTTRHASPSPFAYASQFREPEARQISKSYIVHRTSYMGSPRLNHRWQTHFRCL